MKKPRILFYDIETSPNLAYTWGKYDQNVIAFEKEREMLSYAYSWEGEKATHFDTREGERTDRRLVTGLRKLLMSADITVAHNGDQFDNKIAKVRMLAHHLAPLKILCSVDTKKAAKAYFSFNGNSLNDLANFLKIGQKIPNTGFDMWKRCMANDPAAWREMVRYNRHDVVILKAVYARLRPWIENHPNVARILRPYDKSISACPNCGSKRSQKRGFRATAASVKQEWSCNDCGRRFTTRLLNEKERA